MTKRLVALLFVSAIACAGTRPGPFTPAPLVTKDDDRHPIAKPAEYWSSLYWSGMDETLLAPISRTLAVEVTPPAVNVNALGEVPDSSWFVNRIGANAIPPERVARGACEVDDGLSDGPWIAKSAKVDGGNPGFVIEDAKTKKRYLLKFDDASQPERQTAADVVGSKIYWAFGMYAPCNFIVDFDPSIVTVGPDAKKTNAVGKKIPLTEADLEKAMKSAPRLANGRIRASASLFVSGEPLGPWTFEGVRKDDPNDVVPHQDRRDVRGSRLIAAWINHYDARDQNTMTTFVKTDGDLGYVKHWMIDFGDGFGAVWPSDDMSRRLGYSYYFDFSDISGDLLTLGARVRPWDVVQQDENAKLFGYYDVEHFEPKHWKAGYPNIAFTRMDNYDGYWAAKIIARFSDATIAAMVAEAKLSNPEHAKVLTQLLAGRRDAIVRDYLFAVTSLERPEVRDNNLCFEDVTVATHYAPVDHQNYEASSYAEGGQPNAWQAVSVDSEGHGCVPLARDGVIEVRVHRTPSAYAVPSVYFHMVDGALAGLERGMPH